MSDQIEFDRINTKIGRKMSGDRRLSLALFMQFLQCGVFLRNHFIKRFGLFRHTLHVIHLLSEKVPYTIGNCPMSDCYFAHCREFELAMPHSFDHLL